MKKLKAVIAQLNFLVGDIEGNTQKVIDSIQIAEKEKHADLIIFPELTLTSYSAQDLWLRPHLYCEVQSALQRILELKSSIGIILGYPVQVENHFYNEVAFIQNGSILATYQKQFLPNYRVFDEKRYFLEGKKTACVVSFYGIKIALLICEDLWHEAPIQQAMQAGAQFIISINASPFTTQKQSERLVLLKKHSQAHHVPILYANHVGAQDELVFDGGSFLVNAKGDVIQQAPYFKEALWEVPLSTDEILPCKTPIPSTIQNIYDTLVVGTRNYIEKNHFQGALIGLSGGIDSALTLAVAVDAIGKDRVKAVMMPSRFTSKQSIDYARRQAQCLEVQYDEISIDVIFEEFLRALNLPETGVPSENIQARCRGSLLMALSNQTGFIVLTTGNKSELAVGYSTLYGDMAGGFSVLKDIYKTIVFQLSEYRNQISPVILPEIIRRPPSAELAFNQKDEDTLPPYEVLDEILEYFIEKNEGIEQIVRKGFDQKIVEDIVHRIRKNEYKRKQSPIGVKITPIAFGNDWRYPATNGYKEKL